MCVISLCTRGALDALVTRPLNCGVRRLARCSAWLQFANSCCIGFPPPGLLAPPDDEIAHALYFMLWHIDDQNVCVDGWMQFRIIRESENSLDAVGLMSLLPTGSVPMEVSVSATERGLAWSAQVARREPAWLSLSASKQWKQVCLYASGELEKPQWTWERRYEGSVPHADA